MNFSLKLKVKELYQFGVASGEQLHVVGGDVGPLGVLGEGLQILGGPPRLVRGQVAERGDHLRRELHTQLRLQLRAEVEHRQLHGSFQFLKCPNDLYP